MEERPARVVVVGSVNEDVLVRVDRLPLPGETVLARSAKRSAGGKGANQAVAAARFGARVRFVGAVGDDVSGRRLGSGLVADGIEIELATRSGVETGAAWVMVDGDGANSIVVIPGACGVLLSTRDSPPPTTQLSTVDPTPGATGPSWPCGRMRTGE